MLKEEARNIQVFFVPHGDLYSKVSNIGNGIDTTRSPDDLEYILNISISENLELFHAINTLCISGHKVSFSGKPNIPISAP